MKRWTAILLAVCLTGALGVAAADEAISQAAYNELADMLSEMSGLLDQIIYMTGQAMNAEDTGLYRQGILNLMLGPVWPDYDLEHAFTVTNGDGLAPRMLTMDAGAASLVVDGERRTEFDLSWRHFEEFLSLAIEALIGNAAQHIEAEETGIAVEPRYRDAYAYLISARGAVAGPYVIPGLATVLTLIPVEEMWVGVGESIQEAIDRIPEGGTIYLEPGTYFETIRIAKSVNVIGSEWGVTTISRPTFDEEPSREERYLLDPTIRVDSTEPVEVELKRLQVGGELSWIWIEGQPFVRLEDVTVSGGKLGIGGQAEVEARDCEIQARWSALSVSGGAYVQLEHCVLTGPPNSRAIYSDEILFPEPGVFVWDEPYVRLVACEISGFTGDGVSIGGAHIVALVDSRIHDNGGFGIMVMGRSDCRDALNSFDGSGIRYFRPEFTGRVIGSGNYIPGPDSPDGNLAGAICSPTLSWLIKTTDDESSNEPD